MKIAACSLLFLSSAVSGFVFQRQPSFGIANTALFSSVRPDASEAILAAVEASKKYGPTSPEARVAWDVVEELDASDNTAAYSGSLDDECLTEEEISQSCIEYGEKLDELAGLVQEQAPYIEKMKALAKDMQAIKVAPPPSKAGSDSPELRAALENARQLSEKHGATSSEAKVAWSEVEEIASSGTSNAIGKRLDEECLVETAMDACAALDELNRALNLNKNDGDRFSG